MTNPAPKALFRWTLAVLALLSVPIAPGAAAAQTLTKATARHVNVDLRNAGAALDRSFNLSVGSDYAGTMLRPENLEQLRIARDELGFRYIRFHAIFHDKLRIVRVDNGRTVYDWRKVDQLYDAFLAMGIRPFVELGFTPEAMATSKQTIFYWKGNTSHPEPRAWVALVDAFVRHVRERYGATEVRRWYFEVWNEPNLGGFWENANQNAYFELYEITARAIKAIDPRIRVGGPATAGAGWVSEFLDHATRRHIPVDFVSTHTYGVDGGFLDETGQDDNKLSTNPDAVIADVLKVRRQIAVSKFRGIPLFFTEWSASYNPRDPVHDSYISAAYVLTKLKATRGIAQGMSYWTYSDLFEEAGPPPTPFHGGFGLMNREGIRKPAWFAFKYLNQLRGRDVPLSDDQSIVATDGGRTGILLWDWQQPVQTISNRPFFTKVLPAQPAPATTLRVSGMKPGPYRLSVRRTGFRANDAHTRYLEMKSPESLSASQREELERLTLDLPEISRPIRVGADGRFTLPLAMRANDVVLVLVEPLATKPKQRR
ncbi:GH39 family glycosyl hydrolase [Sphingomonas elodea]|uniref:GH39 family glycosyl hydrolase n=1 Tax=Sphingomonas elodea TaxID=179878 RepID=UPI0002630D40|nr:cellulase family glycosylhydrolase [Sphingomonas elodea]